MKIIIDTKSLMVSNAGEKRKESYGTKVAVMDPTNDKNIQEETNQEATYLTI